MSSQLAGQLTQRFFRYLAITSQSLAGAPTLPSTPGQHEMAQLLARELRELGLDDVVIEALLNKSDSDKSPPRR